MFSSLWPPGNSDSNPGFDDDVPTSLHFSQFDLAVGAVNKAGDETSFTSFGESVVPRCKRV